MLDAPSHSVRDTAFCVAPMRKGFLLRDDRFAFIQYGETAKGGLELFDMHKDPKQYTNLVGNPEFAPVVARYRERLTAKLSELRNNDL